MIGFEINGLELSIERDLNDEALAVTEANVLDPETLEQPGYQEGDEFPVERARAMLDDDDWHEIRCRWAQHQADTRDDIRSGGI